MKKAEFNMTSAIPIAIFVIIGTIAILIASGVINTNIQTTAITDKQFTASNNTCVQVTNNCMLSIGTFTNATMGTAIGASNFSLCKYSGSYAQGIKLLPNDGITAAYYTGKVINTTYTEVSCAYVNNSIVQTLEPFIIILLAVIVFFGVTKWLQDR